MFERVLVCRLRLQVRFVIIVAGGKKRPAFRLPVKTDRSHMVRFDVELGNRKLLPRVPGVPIVVTFHYADQLFCRSLLNVVYFLNFAFRDQLFNHL